MAATARLARAMEIALGDKGAAQDFLNMLGPVSPSSTTTKLGLFGVTAVARPTAYTQTYATATRTHSNPTGTSVTDAFGTADGTIADVGGAFNQTTLNNNFQDLSTAVNAIIVDLANAKQVMNQVIDDLQAFGLLQ